MPPRSALPLAALALGGAVLVFWWWHREPGVHPASGFTDPFARAHSPASTTRSPTAPVSPRRAELDDALAALLQAIALGEARPGETVLTFRDEVSLDRFHRQAEAAGLRVTGHLPGLRALRVRFDDPSTLRRALLAPGGEPATLGANAFVTLPLPPAREERPHVTQVPFGNSTLAFLGADGDRSAWGRGITIAVLDTGVAADPTFGTGRVRTLDLGLGVAPGRGASDGHATAIAALAAGARPDAPGVAPAAGLLSLRVTDASGTSDLFTLAEAIVAATDAGARILNISLGASTTGPVLNGAIAYATERGAVIVAAAGNDQAARLAWPAADPRVISVGAVDRLEQQVTFSNSGSQLKLSAPGYGVETAWLEGRRVSLSGTSASAPLVAGAIATLLSLNPFLTPAQAAEQLYRTANDAGLPGTDPAFGHGVVNLATALNRGNPNYVDTALASQYYDAAAREFVFTVQNRSGRTVGGLTLNVDAAGQRSTQPVPSLAAGETFVARVGVDLNPLPPAAAAAPTRVTGTVVNPPGTSDAVPANNQRTSVVTGENPP